MRPRLLVRHHVAGEVGLDAVELVQDLLEPQLVGLVHDDEQHLVVRRPAVPRALRLLGGEQPVELQIVGVVGAALRRRSVGHRGAFRMAYIAPTFSRQSHFRTENRFPPPGQAFS